MVMQEELSDDLSKIKPPIHRKIIIVPEYYRSPNPVYGEKPRFHMALDEICVLENTGWVVEKITTGVSRFPSGITETRHYYHLKYRGILP